MAIDFEVENERFLLVLKRVHLRMESAEAKNRRHDQEMEEAEANIHQMQLEIDKLCVENAVLLKAIGNQQPSERLHTEAPRGETTKGSCTRCNMVHAGEARACNLQDAVKDNDIPGVRVYLSISTPEDRERCIDGFTPLRWAAKTGAVDILGMLLNAGAYHEPADFNGPIHTACRYGKTLVVHRLLEHGVSVNIPNHIGFTPLHVAAQHGHADTVRFLLASNADPSCKDKDGKTPLDIAKQFDKLDIVQMVPNRAHTEGEPNRRQNANRDCRVS